jgi:hypothetical protein
VVGAINMTELSGDAPRPSDFGTRNHAASLLALAGHRLEGVTNLEGEALMALLISCIITVISFAGLSVGIFAAPVAAQSTSTSILCEEGCLLPPAGLIGWWPGDGNAKDIQLGNDGTLETGATFSAGLVGRAFLSTATMPISTCQTRRPCTRFSQRSLWA